MKELLEEATKQIVSAYEELSKNEDVKDDTLQDLVGAVHRLNKIYNNIYGE